MLPMKLTADDSESERARYKIVRRDLFIDVPGLILSADELSGLCTLRLDSNETEEHDFGPYGLKIMVR